MVWHLPSSDIGLAYYILEWLIRIAALVVVPMKRAPSPTRGWLLLIFFLPVPGLVLFWLIGRPRFPAWRVKRFRKLRPFYQELADRLRDAAPPPPGPNAAAEALAMKLGLLPAVGGNHVELIDDHDGLIARLIADIDGARERVCLLVYIFADDAVGRSVMEALERAARRGVACRVMVDPVGSHASIRAVLRRLREAGVDAREALPFRLFSGRTRRDMRNHRKLFVIDDAIGYAGSQNIISKDFRPGVTNRELVARVTGPVVAEIEATVRSDWYLETEVMPPAPARIPAATGTACCQLLPSGANYPLEGFETLLVWQLHQAQKRVMIATPYFIPDEDVLGAMRTAVQRGVAIELIVSAVVDQELVNLAQCSYYDDLLGAGVRIHLFRDYLLHAKNVSVDGRLAVVGSSNVDLRSFQLNEEASLIFHDEASVAQVEAMQETYLDNSDQLDRAKWRERPHARRLAENIARLVSPLL